jgi:hypothetical protein
MSDLWPDIKFPPINLYSVPKNTEVENDPWPDNPAEAYAFAEPWWWERYEKKRAEMIAKNIPPDIKK